MAETVPHIRALKARAVNVPMKRPLATGGGSVAAAPLVLIDLQTDGGPTGTAYVFCYTAVALKPVAALIENLNESVRGEPLAPAALYQKLQRRFTLLGPQGLAGLAIAGIDTACWDALARAHGVPLVRLLGGVPRSIPAYNSNGLGLIGADRVGDEALALLEGGFKAIKIRLGYPSLSEDVAAVRAVRRAVGPDIDIMSDYNQCLDVAEAIRRGRALDGEGLAWIEEPTRADDYDGHARIATALDTPVQLGENLWGPHDMAKMIAARAGDLVMPDAVKIWGVTGWLKAAALAETAALPMSSHLFPEVSRHLLAITPTCHWLEYVDWAAPVLQEPVRVTNGLVSIPDRPGHGMTWNEAAVKRFLVA
jgi:mandelate racemase